MTSITPVTFPVDYFALTRQYDWQEVQRQYGNNIDQVAFVEIGGHRIEGQKFCGLDENMLPVPTPELPARRKIGPLV